MCRLSLFCFLLLGCEHQKPQPMGCAGAACISGQVCCIDCDGKGTCGAPGTRCPGLACASPDASMPPDAGIACADKSCPARQICCIDCDGKGSCGAPGSVCSGSACSCGQDGQACCSAGSACQDKLTCCVGVPYPSGGECAADCPLRSDRDLKEKIQKVDPSAILDRLTRIPVRSWSYVDDPSTRHIGPMAQDFFTAFQLGKSDRRIDPVDANGVLVAAVQALNQEVSQLRAENKRLARSLHELSRERGRQPTPYDPDCADRRHMRTTWE